MGAEQFHIGRSCWFSFSGSRFTMGWIYSQFRTVAFGALWFEQPHEDKGKAVGERVSQHDFLRRGFLQGHTHGRPRSSFLISLHHVSSLSFIRANLLLPSRIARIILAHQAHNMQSCNFLLSGIRVAIDLNLCKVLMTRKSVAHRM